MKKKKKFLNWLDIAGSILIAAGLAFIFFTFAPVVKEEASYQVHQVLPQTKKPLEPPNTDFSIVIPKIEAAAPIIANVNPYDPAIYLPALQKGVAQASGTSLPGEGGNVYLFAHSTDAFYNVGRYNAVFYLIGKLEKGDEIDIYYKGEKISYEVTEKKVVAPEAIKYLGNFDNNKDILTLQTCYPPGTTLRRLVVLAIPKN